MGKTKKSASSARKVTKDTTTQPSKIVTAPSHHTATKSSKVATPAATSSTKTVKATVEARLLAELPPLTNTQRSAFRKQFSAAKCDEKGGRTKSEGVLSESRAHAATIAKALTKHAVALRRYGTARFTWLLECIAALDEAREAQRAADGSKSAAKSRADRAAMSADTTREDLVDALSVMAEGSEADERTLSAANGTTKNPKKPVEALRALAALAREWLARPDEETKALAASVSLTVADAEAAEVAADALEQASGDKTIEGRIIVKDNPSVNRAEGRVLLELRLAMQAFARANERNKLIPKLSPGPATRPAIGSRSAAASEPEAPAASADSAGSVKPAGT